MSTGILGKKLGMTQVFDEAGNVVPVTAIEAGPCVVLQVKNEESDGYEALQLGFGDKGRSKANAPQAGVAKKASTEPKSFVKEIKQPAGDYNRGDVIDVSILEEVEYVDISGISKGKGFAGVVKRWGFAGYPASHGATVHRRPGSIGQASDPSRVFKGMKMAGHMGSRKRTSKRMKVVRADKDNNLLLVKGTVPGPKGGYVIVRVNND